jgi:hypothetical protein
MYENEARFLRDALAAGKIINITGGDDKEAFVIRLVNSKESMREEAYLIETDLSSREAVITAGSPRGMLYGCRTLLQMIEHSYDDSVRRARISDYPRKLFRGIKTPAFDPGRTGEIISLIETAAKFKLNKIIMPMSISTDKSDGLKAVAEAAAKNHMDIIPCFGWNDLTAASESETKIKNITELCSVKLAEADFSGFGGLSCSYGELAEKIEQARSVLAKLGVKMAVSSEMLHPSTGGRKRRYNEATGKNEIIEPTFEAAGEISKKIVIFDFTRGSDGYFTEKGFSVVYGNCSGNFPQLARLISNAHENANANANALGGFAHVSGSGADPLGCAELKTLLRLSCLLWWNNFSFDDPADSYGNLLPDYLERQIAQLYPKERDALSGARRPSSENPGYSSVDLSAFYNAALQTGSWRIDDYYLLPLQHAMTLPNSVPFNLFKGVENFGYDYSIIMAGGTWNGGVYGIPVKKSAKSVCFMHSYLFGKSQHIGGTYKIPGKIIGRYAVRYTDGTAESADIIYGRDICGWDEKSGAGAYNADPAVAGITPEGMRYALYSSEWINPHPEKEIGSVDVIPAGDADGRIALFAITLVV